MLGVRLTISYPQLSMCHFACFVNKNVAPHFKTVRNLFGRYWLKTKLGQMRWLCVCTGWYKTSVIVGLQELNGIKETIVAAVKERSSIFPSSKQLDCRANSSPWEVRPWSNTWKYNYVLCPIVFSGILHMLSGDEVLDWEFKQIWPEQNTSNFFPHGFICFLNIFPPLSPPKLCGINLLCLPFQLCLLILGIVSLSFQVLEHHFKMQLLTLKINSE